jgi:hypothetical protein
MLMCNLAYHVVYVRMVLLSFVLCTDKFEKNLIVNLDNVAWWTVNKTENSNTNCNRILKYKLNSMFKLKREILPVLN